MISVKQVPEGTVGLVVPLSFNANFVNISSVGSDSDGALVVFSQGGVGIIQTNGNLPSTFRLTVIFNALQRGKTKITLGEVVDKLGGTAIPGAIAKTKIKKIKVK